MTQLVGEQLNTHKIAGATADESQDANLSELIFAVMQYIGEWRPENIFVEQLPPRLLDRIATLYNTISEKNQEVTKEFEDFLKDFIGADGAESGGATGTAGGGPAAFRNAANKWGKETGVDPAIIMGIASVETDFGNNNRTSTAGAKGFTQFMPQTRQTYLDKYNVDAWGSISEACHATALYLRDSGFKKSVHDAIYAYNHSESYVASVLAAAEKYRNTTSDSSSSSSSTSTNEADKQAKDTSHSDTTKPGHGDSGSSKSDSPYSFPFAPKVFDLPHSIDHGVDFESDTLFLFMLLVME
jgi:membrane-bound lytic murein transglycosylase B